MESYLENNENSFFSFPILKKALRCLLSSLEYKSISLLTSFYWKMFKSLFSKRILSCLMFMKKKVFMKAFDDWLEMKLSKRFFFVVSKKKNIEIFVWENCMCISSHNLWLSYWSMRNSVHSCEAVFTLWKHYIIYNVYLSVLNGGA